METIKASEFKAKCLQLMNQVARTREPLIITKNGVPVAQLGPIVRKASTLIGLHKDRITIKGDILAPLDEPWEAQC